MPQDNKFYTISEFCSLLTEKQEFNPVKGKNVDSENKKNNGKAVSDILNRTSKKNVLKTSFDGQNNKYDYNKTTLDYEFDNEPADAYKKRVKAQALGYSSDDNMKNSKDYPENDSNYYDGNEKFYKERKEKNSELAKNKKILKKSGLAARKWSDKIFDKGSMYTNEAKTIKRLNFNKTVFLNEEHMLKKIPDDMKFNGNRFFMKDSIGNEYLIECVRDKCVRNYVHTKVLQYTNKNKIEESFNRMKELYSYSSNSSKQNSSSFENKMVGKMLSETKENLFNNDSVKRKEN